MQEFDERFMAVKNHVRQTKWNQIKIAQFNK